MAAHPPGASMPVMDMWPETSKACAVDVVAPGDPLPCSECAFWHVGLGACLFPYEVPRESLPDEVRAADALVETSR